MRGVIKIPTPTTPPPPPVPSVSVPIFDYTIDIYADKIVVTDASGNTVATLSTIDDLNNWLKNVRGKKIRINVNDVVMQDLVLTSNEYWIYGEWIDANVRILEPNTTIYSWAPMGNKEYALFVTNKSPDTNDFVDASGLRLYAFTYADVDIEGKQGVFTLQDIIIYVAWSVASYIKFASGDVYIQGADIWLQDSSLRNAYVVAWKELYLVRVAGNLGNWIMISYSDTAVVDCSLTDVRYAYLSLTRKEGVAVNPNSSATINLLYLSIGSNLGGIWYYVKTIGLLKQTGKTLNSAIDPLPSGVTWSIDPDNAQLTITNNTTSTLNIQVVYCVEISMW
jgi:hypothetical protein